MVTTKLFLSNFVTGKDTLFPENSIEMSCWSLLKRTVINPGCGNEVNQQ